MVLLCLFVCSCSTLLVFTTSFSCTGCSLCHAAFPGFFCCFFRASTNLSCFCNILTHFSLYSCWFMFFYFGWRHRFLFVIFFSRIFLSISLCTSSTFFIF